MCNKKKLFKINKAASKSALEIKAVLNALSEIEQGSYPSNVQKKVVDVFYTIEKSRKILKITD